MLRIGPRRSAVGLLIASVVGVLIVSVAMAGGATWLAFDWFDPFNDRRFDPVAWTAGSAETRAPMARDVIRNHLPIGLPTAVVVSLLGEPEDVLRGSDAGGNHLLGDETYAYGLGSWSGYGFDDAFLYVHLGSDGRVTGAEINGY